MVATIAWSPDGKRIAATAYQDKNVYLWNVEPEHLIAKVEKDVVSDVGPAVAFTPDDRYVLSTARRVGQTNFKDTTLLLDAHMGGEVGGLAVPANPPSNWILVKIAFDPAGKWIAESFPTLQKTGMTILIYDAASLKIRRTIITNPVFSEPPTMDHEHILYTDNILSVSPDGRELMLAATYTKLINRAGNIAQRQTLQFWNVETGKLDREFDVTQPNLQFMFPEFQDAAFSPDGKNVVTGFNNTKLDHIFIWNSQTGAPVKTIPNVSPYNSINAITWTPGGRYILASSNEGVIRAYNALSGEFVDSLKISGFCDAIRISPGWHTRGL